VRGEGFQGFRVSRSRSLKVAGFQNTLGCRFVPDICSVCTSEWRARIDVRFRRMRLAGSTGPSKGGIDLGYTRSARPPFCSPARTSFTLMTRPFTMLLTVLMAAVYAMAQFGQPGRVADCSRAGVPVCGDLSGHPAKEWTAEVAGEGEHSLRAGFRFQVSGLRS